MSSVDCLMTKTRSNITVMSAPYAGYSSESITAVSTCFFPSLELEVEKTTFIVANVISVG